LRTLLVAVLLTIGCDKPPHELAWVLEADVSVLARATSIETSIRAGGCDGTEVYRAVFSLGDVTNAPVPDRLPRGTYGFHARAQDETCTWIAEGCTVLGLPADGELVVALDTTGDSVGSAACPSADCRAGICVDPTMDAGLDADGGGGCSDGTDPPCETCESSIFSLGRLDLPGSDIAYYPTAQLGADGRVHVAYHTGSGSIVYASRPVSGLFRAHLVDDVDQPGDELAMAAAGGGQHLVYETTAGGRRLTHAFRTAPELQWSVEEIAPTPAQARGVDVVVGPAGLFAVWADGNTLHVAERPPTGAWTDAPVTLPDVDGRSPRPSLVDAALADDGTLHVVFRNEDRGYATYARRDAAGTWTVEHLRDTGGDTGGAVAYSESVGLRIAYADGMGDLVLASAAPGSPMLMHELPAGDEDIRGEIGIAIDEAGLTHLAYASQSGGPVVYRSFGPAGVSAAEMVAEGNVGNYVEVVLEGDTPVILFSDDGQAATRVARRRTAGLFETQIVHPGDRSSSHIGATVDDDGRLIVAVQDEGPREVRSVCRSTEGDWAIEVVPSTDTGRRTAMAMTSEGGVYVLFDDADADTVRAVYRDEAGGWSHETIDPASRDYQAMTLTTGPDGVVHAAYVADRQLWHSQRAPGLAWTRPLAVAVGEVESRVAIVAAADASVHFIYVVHRERRLSHARLVGSSASVMGVIDEEGGDSFSLTLGASGLLHLAYQRGREVFKGTGTLDGSWAPSQLVAEAPNSSWLPAIAIDPSGGIGIAYAAGENWSSGDASGTTWRTQYVHAPSGSAFLPPEMVQGFGQAGREGVSLVYLPDGSPFVLYYGEDHTRQLRSAVGPRAD